MKSFKELKLQDDDIILHTSVENPSSAWHKINELIDHVETLTDRVEMLEERLRNKL